MKLKDILITEAFSVRDLPTLLPDPVDNAEPLDVLKKEPYEQDFEVGEYKRYLAQHLNKLSANRRAVIQMRFFDGMTFDEIGRVIGVTKERVRQIEARALRLIRQSIGRDQWKKEYIMRNNLSNE